MTIHNPKASRQRAMMRRAGAQVGGRFWRTLPTRLFEPMLVRVDRGLMRGSLELHLPDGSVRLLGGRKQGFSAIVRLANWRALIRLAASGSTGWYRAWADGDWSSPDPVALFALFGANARSLGKSARSTGLPRLMGRWKLARRHNSRRGARRNIAEHYDLGNDFYRLWLDETLTYSSARPTHPHETLEAAQVRKIDELLARLDLKDGQQLLEIGCGWGGLAERALARADIGYTGLTLSTEQQQIVGGRIEGLGAQDRAQVLLQDYRDCAGRFDAIASVEMVEAVGERYWPTYLTCIARLLKPGGRAAIQYISIDDEIFPAYAARADFIQRYIFPGGCLIAERRFRHLAEREGLEWADQTRFGLDYAWTLRQWRARFDAVVDAGRLPARFDARFVDMWRYYLMYCEGGFAGRSIDVSQVTLIKR
ncbi:MULTISPECIES: SAM-dependent methyltransferase [unclassified Sphingobium]|uniref:SAM-dependent methyltransferase n=1 Tax=unclassified Sphingobium TaxID=2611147 RepID=UPI0022251EEF|nr:MULTISPECIES: cyclopropane-fatty-acyl-phospholipid synthase family protein [unclassified Sphingobium]MCW2394455.1 cyclopropane-fatty-acyl-phospholipid synthase [Sphingobium sp. B8D3B]MCW2417969.1 cyclopropane-fatty-acyl-phospholipid synthase [Sphingobium sp. B8D3C]